MHHPAPRPGKGIRLRGVVLRQHPVLTDSHLEAETSPFIKLPVAGVVG